jgi:microcystin-dependent protein
VNTASGPSTIINSVAAASGNNLQPVLGLTYIICVAGIFPTQTS